MQTEAMVEDALRELPTSLRMFMRFEQLHLRRAERFRDRLAKSAIEQRYLPESGGVFRLPCFFVARKHLYIYGQSEESSVDLLQGDAGIEGSLLFPVHPGELQQYASFMSSVGARCDEEAGLHILATPTSSTRTVLAWPQGRAEDASFIKLSLSSRMLGDRRLTRRKIAVSVGLSECVRQGNMGLPAQIHFLQEPFGLTPRGLPDGGVLFRCIPEEVRHGVILAPLFSLVGGSGVYRPLLLQLVERDRVAALGMLEEVLLVRFARLWVDLVFDLGLFLEAHGQDLLLAMSPDLVPLGSFYYRDFEGLAVDWALRRCRGLTEPCFPNSCEWFLTYETWGHRLHQLVSMKMATSLYDYVHLVLEELEVALLEWQRSGVTLGERISEGELTLRFSRYMRQAVWEKFGMRETQEYDIRHHLKRFVRFLMGVRHEVMREARRAG